MGVDHSRQTFAVELTNDGTQRQSVAQGWAGIDNYHAIVRINQNAIDNGTAIFIRKIFGGTLNHPDAIGDLLRHQIVNAFGCCGQ